MSPDATVRPDPISDDLTWMHHAIQLAERGWGRVLPNPLVGAVIVRDGVAVGEGWHAEFGTAHAEAMALDAAGEHARGATLYVTLEPCNHQGKQPPCVDAILSTGVARVVMAISDPNPIASGGTQRLRDAGVRVDVGVAAQEATSLNAAFVHSHSGSDRPFVAVKLAVSMDGQIADASGSSQWISGPDARAWVHRVRAGVDAIAVGARTAVADDVRLTVRGEITPRIAPTRVIFDRSGILPAMHGVFADVARAPVIVVAGPTASTAYSEALARAGATVLQAETLVDGLRALKAQGITSLLVEGGGRLSGALMHAGLVDRVYQIQCPIWLGDGTPAWGDLGARLLAEAPRWRVTASRSLSAEGDVLMILEH